MGIAGLVILSVVGATMLAYFGSLYNRLVFLKNQCDRAWFNIDVILKQRHDEIPKLIQVCEGYMKYERETLEHVISTRNAAYGARETGDRIKKEGELSAALGRLFALAENYPELKSQEMFVQLQERISQLENELSDRREFYNSATTNYNIGIEVVPTSFVATCVGYRQRELFQVPEPDKRDVEVKFQMP